MVGQGPQDAFSVDPELSPPSPASVAILVFLGGCAGGLARYALELALPAGDTDWPWGIFVANTVGAFGLSVLLVPVLRLRSPASRLRPALGTGFFGAFTTMSGLVVAVDQLARDGHVGTAVGYLAATAVGGLLAAGVGRLVAGRIVRSRNGPDAFRTLPGRAGT